MINQKSKIKSQKSPGFGLLETVVAVGILVIIVSAVVSLQTFNLKNSMVNKHRAQAAYLANEVLSIIKQTRDSYWVNTGLSGAGLQAPCIANGIGSGWCGIRENSPTYLPYWRIQNLGSAQVPADQSPIRINDVNYTRYIQVNSQNDRKDYTVIVEWNDYGKTYVVRAVTTLTNWRP